MSKAAQRKRISLELPVDLLERLDDLKGEWGLRSRGDLLMRLLETLLPGADGQQEESDEPDAEAECDEGDEGEAPAGFDEQGALVLVAGSCSSELLADFDLAIAGLDAATSPNPSKPKGGIDLPGFVRRQSAQLKRSLHPRQAVEDTEVLPAVPQDLVQRALQVAREHWLELYGSTPSEAVLEASMIWLAQDIWPQSDQSDGRPFTWSQAHEVVLGFAPSFPEGAASFERVMVMAGLLEDPFSAATLDLRVPTLIRRFVHRFRKRKRGTSFQTLEHTMTLHGALKLLQLPTAPGHRLTLREIRESYRQMATGAHPDSGGSTEAMRRLNEAYQLLKELYRTAG